MLPRHCSRYATGEGVSAPIISGQHPSHLPYGQVATTRTVGKGNGRPVGWARKSTLGMWTFQPLQHHTFDRHPKCQSNTLVYFLQNADFVQTPLKIQSNRNRKLGGFSKTPKSHISLFRYGKLRNEADVGSAPCLVRKNILSFCDKPLTIATCASLPLPLATAFA